MYKQCIYQLLPSDKTNILYSHYDEILMNSGCMYPVKYVYLCIMTVYNVDLYMFHMKLIQKELLLVHNIQPN